MIATLSPITVAIAVVVLAVGTLALAAVVGGDDRGRPVPGEQPSAPSAPRTPVDHYEMRANGRLVQVPSVVIEGTPLAQQEFAGRIGNDLGRGERVRAAAADERARYLAELEAEHEILRGRRERDAADLIDRVLPDPSTPKGER